MVEEPQMPLAFMSSQPFMLMPHHQCRDHFKSTAHGLWQIGEVIQELLDCYDIDLEAPATEQMGLPGLDVVPWANTRGMPSTACA